MTRPQRRPQRRLRRRLAACRAGHDRADARGPAPLMTGRRIGRPAVVAAALALLDTQGLAALTIRRVGQDLAVQAMSLYRYVVSRDALLDVVVDAVLDELAAAMPGSAWAPRPPPDSWSQYLRELAHAVRRCSLAHPGGFLLLATRRPAENWLRRRCRPATTWRRSSAR